jgi:hypothetical protein
VTIKGKTTSVTGTTATIGGFADGEIVSIDVLAVNLAGQGPKSTTSAKTIIAPTVSNVSTARSATTRMVVKFAYTDGGGRRPACSPINGAARRSRAAPARAGTPRAAVAGQQLQLHGHGPKPAGSDVSTGSASPPRPARHGACANTNLRRSELLQRRHRRLHQLAPADRRGRGDASTAATLRSSARKTACRATRAAARAARRGALQPIQGPAPCGSRSRSAAQQRYIPVDLDQPDAGDNYNMLPDC